MQLTPTERGFRFFKQSFMENPWKELEKSAERQSRNSKQSDGDILEKYRKGRSEANGNNRMREEGEQMPNLETELEHEGDGAGKEMTTKDT